MNQTINAPGAVNEKEASQQLKQQLSHYIQQQPDSIKAFHNWMKGVEVASLALIAAVFVLALYISIGWKNFDPKLIPTTWFIFPASVAPFLLFSGIHTLILRAFPTSLLPGYTQKLVTGRGALWFGWGFISGGLIVVAFWGLFAYATWTQNWALLRPLISIMGFVMTIVILLAMVQKIIKPR